MFAATKSESAQRHGFPTHIIEDINFSVFSLLDNERDISRSEREAAACNGSLDELINQIYDLKTAARSGGL